MKCLVLERLLPLKILCSQRKTVNRMNMISGEGMFDDICSTATRDGKIVKSIVDFESKVELRNMLGSSKFSFAITEDE